MENEEDLFEFNLQMKAPLNFYFDKWKRNILPVSDELTNVFMLYDIALNICSSGEIFEMADIVERMFKRIAESEQ